MVDRFCQPFSSNTSRNKGVLHALITCASGRFADNLCARRPPTDTHITCVAIPDSRCLRLRKLEVPEPEPRHGQVLGQIEKSDKNIAGVSRTIKCSGDAMLEAIIAGRPTLSQDESR